MINHPQHLESHSLSLQQLKKNAHWYLTIGLITELLGILTFLFAYSSSSFSAAHVGLAFVVFGILTAIKTAKVSYWADFFLDLFLTLIYLIGGIFMMWHQALSATMLGLIMAVLLMLSGSSKIAFAFFNSPLNKGPLLINGLGTVSLSSIMLAKWPDFGMPYVGVITGIDILVTGFAVILFWFMAQRIIHTHTRDQEQT